MKHRISRRAFLRGCTLLAASAAVGSLTSCGGTNAKDSGLPQIIVGSDTYFLSSWRAPKRSAAQQRNDRLGPENKSCGKRRHRNLGLLFHQGREKCTATITANGEPSGGCSGCRQRIRCASATLPTRPSPNRAPPASRRRSFSAADPRIPQTVEVLSIENRRAVRAAVLRLCGCHRRPRDRHSAIHEGQFRGVPHFEEPLMVTAPVRVQEPTAVWTAS